jgi:hypothetical protein
MGRVNAEQRSAAGGVRRFDTGSLRFLSVCPHPDAAEGVVGPPHKGEV